MTQPQAPGQGEPKRDIPSFSAEVEKAKAERAADIERVSGAAPAAMETPASDDYDFEGAWNALPERLRTEAGKRFGERFNAHINAQLNERYGDLYPLLEVIEKRPEVRRGLAEIATKDDMLALIADPDVRSAAARLTNKELREFLMGDGIAAYEKYTPAQPSQPARDPRDERIAALESGFAADKDARETATFVSGRQREMLAMRNEFGDLKDDQKLLNHIVTMAEQEFERGALRAGIDIKNDGEWPARAIRAGVKPPSYREAYLYFAEATGRTKPPSAPGGSGTPEPRAPAQAPRDAAEGKQRALTLLKNSGGLEGLQRRKARS